MLEDRLRVPVKAIRKTIGLRLQQMREREMVSREQLALESALPMDFLRRIEEGDISVTVEILVQLACVLRADVNDFLEGIPE